MADSNAAPVEPESDARVGPYPRAPLARRLFAFLADSVIATQLLPLGILLVVAGRIAGDVPALALWILAAAIVWQFTYGIARDGFDGAGFGKRLLLLVVTDVETGQPVALLPAALRALVLLGASIVLPVIGLFVEGIAILGDKDGRRWGDRFARTQVARNIDVDERGHEAPIGRRAAAAVLALSAVVWIVGALIGAYAVQIALGRAEPIDFEGFFDIPGITTDDFVPPAADGGVETTTAPRPSVPVVTTKAPKPEEAVETVDKFLRAMQTNDADVMRELSTEKLQKEMSHLYAGMGAALRSFVILEVQETDVNCLVIVESRWASGTGTTPYVVIDRSGDVLIDEILR